MKKLALLVLVVFLSLHGLMAQSVTSLLPGGAKAQTPTPAPTDELGRGTPSGTVLGFLQAAQAGNYQTAADYLQMSTARRQSQGPDLAEKLKVLMDRTFVGSLRKLSTSPEGNPDYGVLDQQTIGIFSNGDTDVPVVLVRVGDPNSGKIWLFSSETLSKVPELYDNLQAHQVENKLPQSLVRNVFLGMPLWQWLALLAAIPVALAIGWAVVLLLAIPRRLWLKLKHRPNLHSYSQMSRPLLLSFSALAHRVIVGYLGLPLLPRLYYYRTINVLISIGFFWFLLRAVSLTMQRMRTRAISAGRTGTGTLMVLGERLLAALVVIAAILTAFGILGFNLTTLLAGLGIGGIAIAFAAQKTLENLFGGISVLGDEVIRVGDYCRFGDRIGTVEDISLRSTRIRTDARTQVSIPNGTLATMSIENFSRRDKILFNPALAIRYETAADQLRYLLAEIRRMLYEHPKVENESAYIRFANFDNSALRLEIFSYVLTQDANEYSAIREDLLLRIMEIVEKSGSGFAFPSQTVYFSRDSGIDKEKASAAEQQVQQWRDQHQLPFPDFAAADKSAFRGSIVYPPPESAIGKTQEFP
ncbi:MAG: mechanosensitive ion channel domain-containing protein [Terriglobales bacterium]|jgi:MscS family membrane protein